MTDAETSAAIDALARRLRQRDEAMRDGAEDVADAEPFANEFITALRGRGWRPTPAKVYAAPKPPGARPAASLPDDYRAIRAEWEARPHPYRRDEEAS